MRYAVIMAGGAGTRLWPAARRRLPKQLQTLIFDRPLIAETVHRLAQYYDLSRILIVTGARYVEPIRELLPELRAENIIAEPFGRNTAAAIALAAFRVAGDDSAAAFAVFPADHVVLKPEALFQALDFGHELAERHRVVDIGVPPAHPETGYGYIELAERIESRDDVEAFAVRRFVEKPDRERAREYVEAGNYMWNSGMFIWRAAEFLSALREYLPETYEALGPAVQSGDAAQIEKAYERIPDISVDYAIMEKASDVVAVPVDFGWRDIGDWAALYDLLDHDVDGNAVPGRHVTLDTRNSLFVTGKKLVAAIGIEDLVVVDTEDVLLLMPRERAQDVKKILERLKERGEEDYL